MGLNIKNEHTHALVRELAALTGRSQTSAVEDAVSRRLAELREAAGGRTRRPPSRFTDAEIARRTADIEHILDALEPETTPTQRAALARADEDLYDDQGLFA